MLGHRVALGAALLTAMQFVAKLISIVSIVIMARLLTPADFGLVALAASVLAIVSAFTELNVSDALVQRAEITQAEIDNAFTLNLLRGLSVSLIVVCAAVPVARLYNDDRLVPILIALSTVPFINSLGSPALVHFLRRLEYGPTAKTQFASQLAGFVVSLCFAFVTRSYWALIIGQFVAGLASTALSYVIAPYRPRLRIAGSTTILQFAGWMTASRIVSTVNLQSDRFLIGSILGKAQLGQYTVGSDIASMATYAFAGPIMQTMFGGFARLEGDLDRTRAAYLKGQQLLVIVLLPLGFGLAVIADRLVPLILGPNWGGAIAVIYWLAPVVSLQVLYLPMLSLAMAMGRPKVLVLRETVNLIMRAPLTIAGAIYFGLLGAVIARAVGGVAIIVMTLFIAGRFIQISVIRQVLNAWRSLSSIMVMVAGVELLKYALVPPTELPMQIVQLASLVFAGSTLYVASHISFWKLTGRPDGAERFLLDALQRFLTRLRR